MKWQLLFSLLVLVFVPGLARAFINIESVRMSTTEDFVGKSTLMLSGQSGNTQKSTSAFSSVNIRRWEEQELLLLIDYAYATSANVRDTNNGRLHLRQTFQHRSARAYEVFVQSELDEFQNLNSRNLVGINIRNQLRKSDNVGLYLGTGIFYEVEDYSQAQDRRHVRGNIYLSYVEKLNELVNGSMVVYYQPLIQHSGDYRVRLQSGLEAKMNPRYSMRLEFELRHENNLPDPRLQKTDMRYLAGFAVSY